MVLTKLLSLWQEFLKVMVSRSCDSAKFFWLPAKSWDLHAQSTNLCILTIFTVFSSLFFTHTKCFLMIFSLFLHKIPKLKFGPYKKSTLKMSVYGIHSTLGLCVLSPCRPLGSTHLSLISSIVHKIETPSCITNCVYSAF